MKINTLLLLIILFLVNISLVSAAHYVIGRVNNALDLTLANDHTVVLWNPSIGLTDNLTDIIGPNGNSGQDNLYMFDCELLNNGCQIGDSLKIKVTNSGNNYISEDSLVTITGAGYDLASEITLNSPPNTTLNIPENLSNFSKSVIFNCSATDLDSNLVNITLYGNWGSGWHENETKFLTGNSNSTTFTKYLEEGTYLWACSSEDNLSISSFSSKNRTINIDNTSPAIYSITLNQSYTCGTSEAIRVNCTTNDSFLGIDKVIIEAIKPSGRENFTTNQIAQDVYFSDIIVDEEGIWKFNCIANDTAGNSQNLSSSEIESHSSKADLIINLENINFSDLNPIENKEITIEALILNNGCQAANNFIVGFYENDPDPDGIQIDNNKTISINQRSNQIVNVSWSAKIGPTNIFVLTDINNSIDEDNKTNNKNNKTIEVGAWQNYYGNLSSNKILGNSELYNLSMWINESTSTGNIFVADKESIINWASLQAIGKNTTGQETTDDFNDIDSIFSMGSFSDSISNIFTTDGNTPKEKDNFIIHSITMEEVPVINSTNTSNFITGILWDTFYDLNGEFDQIENEKLVFVTKINKNTQGSYGAYDYEIKIPARLREQDNTDSSELYFYYELI